MTGFEDYISRKQVYKLIRSYVQEIITESGVDKNAHTNRVLNEIAGKIAMDLKGYDLSELEKKAAISEAENIKAEVIELSYNCEIATDDRYRVEKLIDSHLSELRGENNEKWTPVSEGLPKYRYGRKFLLSIIVDGKKEIITGELSSISDRDEEGKPLNKSHDGFMSFYEPLVGIMHNNPVYNFMQEIPMEYIVAWRPFPEAYKGERK